MSFYVNYELKHLQRLKMFSLIIFLISLNKTLTNEEK